MRASPRRAAGPRSPRHLATGLFPSSLWRLRAGSLPTDTFAIRAHTRGTGARLIVGVQQRRLLLTAARALTGATPATRCRRQRAARARRQQPGLEYAVFWLPRRTIACERVLQEEGVYGDVAAGELPIDFIPFDGDVLSLELDTAFRARALTRRCHTQPRKGFAGLMQM